MVEKFNPSLEKRGRGDFVNDFLSEKSPLSPPLLKGGYSRAKNLKQLLRFLEIIS
jgi:hypothetical protein